MADRYGISSLPEARAYLRHELLGPRLRECARLVERVQGRSVGQIFGSPDDLKLCSSMTLFAHATDDNADFLAVLQKYYDGRQDPVTLARLADSRSGSGSASPAARRPPCRAPPAVGLPSRRSPARAGRPARRAKPAAAHRRC